MSYCRCQRPRVNDRRPGWCRVCGVQLDRRVLSSDENFAEFFDHLLTSPDVHANFVNHCRAREVAGRDTFGLAYLSRENELEATEEVADYGIYLYLAMLRRKREGREVNWAKALEATRHAAIAHQLALELAAEE